MTCADVVSICRWCGERILSTSGGWVDDNENSKCTCSPTEKHKEQAR